MDNRAVNKKAIEALIKCGAFGSTGASRKGMLAVLEQAQAAGSKSQQDALIGQGSIFDLGGVEDGAGAAAAAFAGPGHAPIPTEEFDQNELLTAEKESLGLFVSAHPLKELGPALRAKADASVAELADRRDGDWVTVGGMITQAKKIKTRKGDPMSFVTLSDTEDAVEVIVFGKVMEAAGPALECDSIVLIRGKVEHKERDSTTLVAQQVELFEPTAKEIAAAQAVAAAAPVAPPASLRLRLDAGALPARCLGDLREVLAGHPGEVDVVIELETAVGGRRLRLGPSYRVARSAGLHAELDSLLGDALVVAPAGGAEAPPARIVA